MNTALLLLEIQNDYFPNGRIPLEKSVEASNRAQAILHAYRDKQLPVVHVQHISTQPDATYFLPCTKGAEFHSSVQPIKGETIFKKHYPNSFKDTDLLKYLIKKGINHLVVCGMMTHSSVDATVRAAQDYGFSCTVIHDACATKALDFRQNHSPAQDVQNVIMAALQGNNARVLAADDVLARSSTRVPLAETA